MSWKDDYREDKRESGLSWAEYHDRKFVHVEDLDGMAETIAGLEESVEGLRSEYRRLRWELHEVLLLLGSEDYDP